MTKDNKSKNLLDKKRDLQWMCASYIDNSPTNKFSNFIHRSRRPLKTLVERWKAKEGRLRGNIMGKRVDNSARSVISCDPHISINEVGVPIKIAQNLAINERVNKYNIEKLTKFVRNGPHKYPGAKQVTKMTSEFRGYPPPSIWNLKIANLSTTIELEIGDIVQRNLIDGDVVLFNRQPSLHRMSIMCHKVKVFPTNTFRLNVFDCKPYNADFDKPMVSQLLPC